MSESLLVKAYSISHSLNVNELINDYMILLNNILNDLWRAVIWKEKGKRLIPLIRKDNLFRKSLRDKYIGGWIYSKHYVDSAMKQAYSTLSSWRKRYLKGKADRNKPMLRRKFVRVKETLYSYKDGIIRISVKPFQQYESVDLRKAWFFSRIEGLDLGELIIKEDRLIVTIRRKAGLKIENPIAWDVNLLTLDGYDGQDYTISLKNIYTIHRVYELKRKRIQQLPEGTRKKLFKKYRLREKNKVNYILHKIAKQLADRTNIFEDLKDFKEKVAKTNSRSMNRQNSKHNYIKLQRYVEYKSAWNGYKMIYVSPRNSSKACSRCGYLNKDLKGARIFKCPRCGLVIDRQMNASRNIFNKFLKMWGAGFTLKGANFYDIPSMNPERDEKDEAQELSLNQYKSILSSKPDILKR